MSHEALTAGDPCPSCDRGTLYGQPQGGIALFFSGRQHAGANLRDVLLRRTTDLPRPIRMCDALSRNRPPELETILANCLAHARRQFVDVNEHFPTECRHVLESLRVVYHNDQLAREQQMTAARIRSAAAGPLLLAAGCSRGSTRPLSGAVALGGRPVPRAFIQFRPDADAGNTGPSGSAEVVDGRYRTRPGFGVVKGPYVIRFMPAVLEVGGDGAPAGFAFPDHVVRVDLSGSETTLDFEIPVPATREAGG